MGDVWFPESRNQIRHRNWHHDGTAYWELGLPRDSGKWNHDKNKTTAWDGDKGRAGGRPGKGDFPRHRAEQGVMRRGGETSLVPNVNLSNHIPWRSTFHPFDHLCIELSGHLHMYKIICFCFMCKVICFSMKIHLELLRLFQTLFWVSVFRYL